MTNILTLGRRARVIGGATALLVGLTFAAPTAFAIDGGVAETTAKRCTAGYSPCIAKKASDVDCWGGSGNGPRYTKPGITYHVTGRDRYGLDADNDGLGCE